MKRFTIYLICALCGAEAICIAWLWPKAHRLVPTTGKDGITRTILKAKPGENIFVETEEVGFSAQIWQYKDRSHVAVNRKWGDETVIAWCWTDGTRKTIDGGYGRYRPAEVTSTQSWDVNGVPQKMVSGKWSHLKHLERGSFEWLEKPLSARPLASN